MKNVTDNDKRVLEYISENTKKNGFAPSVRDIQSFMGCGSTSTVHACIRRLCDAGLLTKEQGKSRTLRVESDDSESDGNIIRVVGKVAAGKPILAYEDTEDEFVFYSEKIHADRDRLFALKVCGESMIEAGILDGDTVIVEKRDYAENGEIVVAMIDDEATVKTFYKENGRFRLQPENRTMEPIVTDYVIILGKVVANIRFY